MKNAPGMIKRVILAMAAGAVLGSGFANALDIYVATDGRDA
jgi:hypothetical protein